MSKTLAGYRSAIVNTIAATTGNSTVNLSSSPLISNYLDGFSNQEVLKPISCPQWDVCLVLDLLRKPPFEPLLDSTLSNLTLKTIFLLALASAKRVSAIHALGARQNDITFAVDFSSVTLSHLPKFRAKTQAPSALAVPLTIPALTNILGQDDDDFRLCPVRALRLYLTRTKTLRQARRRLFVSVNPGYSRDISKATISRWLVSTVKQAYQAANVPLANSIKAHELRAIGTSLAESRGLTVDRIMLAAGWVSHSTFTHFYLRDICTASVDGQYSLRAAVVAQQALKF